MSTVLVIVATGLLLFGAYQIPQVREAAAPYVEPAIEALKNVKTEPTGSVIDRPELMPKD